MVVFPPSTGVPPVARKTVLVVDDDRDLRRMFATSLKFAGFDVREASDGTDALNAIDDDAPDVLVLDIGLPTLDGVSVREELAARAATRNLPVVVVSGINIDGSLFRKDCVLRKPVTPEQLVAAVRKCLEL